METLMLRYQTLMKAYSRLEHMIIKLDEAHNISTRDEDNVLAYRDSVIKRFELCYDLTWKLLKLYLKEHYSKVFQACFENNIINQEEAKLLFAMVDDRSSTCHIYDESVANKISERVIAYYKLMIAIVARIRI